MESGLYWKVIWEMVWKVQFLQFFRRVLLFGHSSKQHGSRMQQIGQQLLSCCGFATRNTHHLMSENFYVFVLLWNARNKASGYFLFNARVFSCCNFYDQKNCKNHFPHVFPNDFSVKLRFHTISLSSNSRKHWHCDCWGHRELICQLKETLLACIAWLLSFVVVFEAVVVVCYVNFCKSSLVLIFVGLCCYAKVYNPKKHS